MTPAPRLGKREKFANVTKAQCQVVGCAAMALARATVHENVMGYDSSLLDRSVNDRVLKATLLGQKVYLGLCHPGCVRRCGEARARGLESTGSPGVRTNSGGLTFGTT